MRRRKKCDTEKCDAEKCDTEKCDTEKCDTEMRKECATPKKLATQHPDRQTDETFTF